jgi:hypothetical protein
MNQTTLTVTVICVAIAGALTTTSEARIPYQARTTAPRLEFEVASVKIARAAARGERGVDVGPCAGLPRVENNRFVAQNISAYTLTLWQFRNNLD